MSMQSHFMAAMGIVLAASTVRSQTVEQPNRPRVRGVSAARVLEARFNRFGPQVGDTLPDVDAYDANGNPFKLNSLKGHYTVLNFGCLT